MLVKTALQKGDMVSVKRNVWCFTAAGREGGFKAVHDNQPGGHISVHGSLVGAAYFWVGKGNVNWVDSLAYLPTAPSNAWGP